MPGFDLDRPIIGKVEGPKLRRLQKYFSVPFSASLAVRQGHPHLIEGFFFLVYCSSFPVWRSWKCRRVAGQLLEICFNIAFIFILEILSRQASSPFSPSEHRPNRAFCIVRTAKLYSPIPRLFAKENCRSCISGDEAAKVFLCLSFL